MTVLEIILILAGFLMLFISFLISRRLSKEDEKKVTTLTDEQARALVTKVLSDAEPKIHDAIEEELKSVTEHVDAKTDTETNEKIRQISEYSDSVLDSMNKSHDEIMFMYDMLNDKQAKVTELTKELAGMESEMRALKDALDAAFARAETLGVGNKTEAAETAAAEEASAEADDGEKAPAVSPLAQEERFRDKIGGEVEESPENENRKILTLSAEGYSEVEIAKKLGRGLGEVKLVLGLFRKPAGKAGRKSDAS